VAEDSGGTGQNIVWAGLAEGFPAIRFAGIPGYTYEVQRSTNLTIGVWTTISTNVVPAGGLVDFVDTAAPGGGQVFYRTRRP
jgi:hypothetical protein